MTKPLNIIITGTSMGRGAAIVLGSQVREAEAKALSSSLGRHTSAKVESSDPDTSRRASGMGGKRTLAPIVRYDWKAASTCSLRFPEIFCSD